MTLSMMIITCWLMIVAFTMALMRAAARADADADRQLVERRPVARGRRGRPPGLFAVTIAAERRAGLPDRRRAGASR